MTTKENVHGIIEISPTAIATLVSHAVTQTYGVVGMTTNSRASGVTATLTRDPHRGVMVQTAENEIMIDIYVILEHGVRIASVSTSIINSVRYTVERNTAMPVKSVNIHVQGLRMSQPKANKSS